ncbi:MAG: A/G-specific adenine glycosylase [Gammaproteobacteria bacterium]
MTHSFAEQLLRWWDQHGRHDLPWQQDVTPYRVWVSEIMLQQTQVATVERYYGRFMQSFPDVATLAAATQDDVLHLWSGLGYYSRARNLYKTAQQVVTEHAGVFPETPQELIDLPGIGRSTAGAILALSHDQRHAILDGNAKRVLARYFAVEGWSGATANLKLLWQYAEDCTPADRAANYTQAIMDLGATVCTRSRPTCDECPLAKGCLALSQARVADIPAPKPKKAKPRRSTVMVIAVNAEGDVLLQKRPATGIWGGLWSFPELDRQEEVPAWCERRLQTAPDEMEIWSVVPHSFSHYDLEMQPVKVRLTKQPAAVMDGDQWLWYNTSSPANVGLAAPVARMLQALQNQENADSAFAERAEKKQ